MVEQPHGYMLLSAMLRYDTPGVITRYYVLAAMLRGYAAASCDVTDAR